MSMEYLVVLEVSKKQDFIFKSNRLLENVGGSFIIQKITEEIPYRFINPSKSIYEGGGKSIFSFNTKEETTEFIRSMSRYILEEYPGVELFMKQSKYDNETESIIDAIDNLYKSLEEKKAKRQSSFRLIGIGMNKVCPSTQLPANKEGINGDVANEIYIKQKAIEDEDSFDRFKSSKYKFPKDFDQLGGTKGSKSYIAVVVIDGNKMGEKIQKMKENFVKNKRNDESWEAFNERYKIELNKMSKTIKQAYENAMKSLIRDIENYLPKLIENYNFNLKENLLPIRPIILAGDDVCFVTDARIGVDCARRFLEYVSKYHFNEEPLHACAGVAIVKSHYPFARAHRLAENLCKNAKSKLIGEKDACMIDFHISQGEVSHSIKEIRNKFYNEGNLSFKPFYVTDTNKPNTIQNFDIGMEKIRQEEVSRSKIKSLRDSLRQGKEETQNFVRTNRIEDVINFKGMKGLENEGIWGYYNNQCVYFDIIEIMDTYITLGGNIK